MFHPDETSNSELFPVSNSAALFHLFCLFFGQTLQVKCETVPCSVVSGSNLYSQVGEEWSGFLKDELMLFGKAWCDEEKTQSSQYSSRSVFLQSPMARRCGQ